MVTSSWKIRLHCRTGRASLFGFRRTLAWLSRHLFDTKAMEHARKQTASISKLPHSFFSRPAVDVARDLIGKILVRRIARKLLKARIVETEAYVGEHDLACHASKGRTARTDVMFGPAGRAYVYFIYGMYDMLNIVTGDEGDAQAVLVRAAEPLAKWETDLSGPGKLAREMRITRALNGCDLTGNELYLLDNPADRPKIVTTKRIGVDYAGQWKDAPLRFLDPQSSAVSGPRARTRTA